MEISKLETLLSQQGSKPPIHLWKPELSGDIDIVIKANGEWIHEGELIQRQSLIKLFSSILRREEDGEYYLVTPVEKWRLTVESAPLLITDVDVAASEDGKQSVVFTTNVDSRYLLSKVYPLTVAAEEDSGEPNPIVQLDNGLSAKLNRAVFYRLIDLAEEQGNQLLIESDGVVFTLGAIE